MVTLCSVTEEQRCRAIGALFKQRTSKFYRPSHGLTNGEGPLVVGRMRVPEVIPPGWMRNPLWTSDVGDLPGGLSEGVDYWAIVHDADNFNLAASPEDAADGKVLVLTEVQSATLVARK